MNKLMIVFSFILCLKSEIVKARTESTQYKIGAIFFSDEDDLKLAFEAAIVASNKIHYDWELLPVIRYLPADDSLFLNRLACDLITHNHTMAIFGPSSKASSDIVASICNFAGIPHIRFDSNKDESLVEKLQHSMTINVYPSFSDLSIAYSNIIARFDWKSFTILYDEDKNLSKFQDVLQLFPFHKTGIKVRRINKEEPFDVVWKTIFFSSERKIILDCSPDIVLDILKSADNFNMTGPLNSILLTNLDTNLVDFKDVDGFTADITALKVEIHEIHNRFPITTLKSAIIFDAVQIFSEALTKLRAENHQIYQPNWRCTETERMAWKLGKNIYDIMRNTKTDSDEDYTTNYLTKPIEFNEYGERKSFNIEIYTPVKSKQLISVWIPGGNFTEKKEIGLELTTPKPGLLSSQIKSIIKPHYVVSTIIGEPYLVDKDMNGSLGLEGNAKYAGYSVDLIRYLSNHMNFDFTIKVVPNFVYGRIDPITKEWNGIIRELIDHRADIGICDLTITHERRQAVDFTVPFMSLGISILYYKEAEAPHDIFSFFKPFALEVWMYMATAYLIVSILLFLLSRIAAREWENPHPCNPDPEELENKWCITNTTWLTMGSIMGQGSDILPRTGPMRLVNGMWWFFALMMLNSYTANLAAFLTQSRKTTSIEGINDLAEQNKIQFGTLDGGSTSNFFKESNDSTFRLAWSKMTSAKPSVFTKSNPEGLERVKKSKGSYAYLMETTSLEYMTERNCDVMQVGGQIGEKHYAIALPLDSAFRMQLNIAILKLSEEGILMKLKKKWWKFNNTCEKTETASSGNNELSIEQVGGVFLVLGTGLLVAFIIGVFEFLWNVQQVAVEEKITSMEAFKKESLFALKFWITKKPIRQTENSESFQSQSQRSSQSQVQLQNVNLEKLKPLK